MSGISMKMTGLDEVLKKLDFKGLEAQISDELENFGQEVERVAKDLAPVDEGFLKNSIGFEMIGQLSVNIFCHCEYAAYVEFGTRKYAAAQVSKLPQDWQSYAATFKGKGSGGSFDEFVQNIMAWVQRKGIGALRTKSGNRSGSAASLDAMQSAAYAIALNIIQNGIKAHPFLYPAYEENRKKLIDNLKNLLNA